MSTKAPPTLADHATARACARRLFAFSFVALFLELLLIRWAPSVVRLVAYYANLLLVSSFLGLGLGALTATRRWNLFRWFPLLVAGNVGVLLLCRTATLPDSGSEIRFFAAGGTAMNYLTLVGVFLSNAILFIPLGEQIGELFGKLPTLRAYTWDLLGSLAGTIGFGLFSFLFFSPVLGMAAVLIVVLALSARRHWIWSAPTVLACLAALAWSNPPGAIWSPYYYITVHASNTSTAIAPPPPPTAELRTMRNPPIYSVSVNQDFYQMHGTIDLERYSPGAPQAQLVRYLRDQYLLPYTLATGRKRVAVLGAGGGMDVEAALLSGVRAVDAVDIDPKLIALSRRDNAAGCYDDPRVTVHVNDARAFLQNARPGYDLVVFGFLDSQALFTSMSNLRLDGFTYTVESLQTAYRLLNDDGMLSLSFAVARPWLADKLILMVAEATGTTPLVYMDGGQLIVCAPKEKARTKTPNEAASQFGRFSLMRYDLARLAKLEPATDDWPFLYLQSKTIPADYLLVIGAILAISLASIVRLRTQPWGVSDAHFLFLGLGFLLLETKSIGDCSLYFGSTWLVTTIVVAGVLLMVLAANLVATKIRFSLLLYIPLFAALFFVSNVPPGSVLAQPFTARLAWATLIVPLPIFFAGLIFSTTFRGTLTPAALFGANLVGAMIGGFCEYIGMATGNSALMLLVFAAYGASALCQLKGVGIRLRLRPSPGFPQASPPSAG